MWRIVNNAYQARSRFQKRKNSNNEKSDFDGCQGYAMTFELEQMRSLYDRCMRFACNQKAHIILAHITTTTSTC